MSERRESVSEAVRNWVQVLAFLLAGVWAVYTFVYVRIVEPRSAPVNVSTELQIEDVGEVIDRGNRRLRAVQLTISAVNPSTREVYILPNYWVAYGLTIGGPPEQQAWAGQLTDFMNSRTLLLGGRHYQVEGGELVALNTAFPDDRLKPNERITRTVLFYVPADAYDFIQVEAVLPTAHTENAADLQYSFDGQTLNWKVFAIDRAGERREVTEDDAALAQLEEASGLQLSSTLRQTPLRQTVVFRPE